MESDEQTKLTRKMGTDSLMETWVTALGGLLRGGGTEQKGNRTHRHGQQCGSCWGEVGKRGLNGNGNIQ